MKREAEQKELIDTKKPKRDLLLEEITKPAFVDNYKLEDMRGGDFFYMNEFLKQNEANELYNQALELECKSKTTYAVQTRTNSFITVYRPTLKIYGKDVIQSRQVAVYAIEEKRAHMKYSNHDAKVNHPFPQLVNQIAGRLKEVSEFVSYQWDSYLYPTAGVDFTHCMLNYYQDGSVYIGKHNDNFNNQVIATVSLGAERTIHLSPQTTKAALKVYPETDVPGREKSTLKLTNGSLFVMQGSTQRYWKHEIKKEPKVKTGRISLTYRQIVD
ncbi:hypothetical protein E3Q23_00314 [Wallemia mellicola]|uniref:Fe2OG dioxygenase domain-containing protein n=1 Tax=Wallemia mellicola TaxID=1708541 RepID=A0A4T0M8U6_9BASI|nr:hypothetical protein E3Q24_02746 [Wallemia mellicola]TIB79148.1 hypothetical protein E3Q23_00314 [Wallemia mellicola]TIB87435.1 hypothetical protein E3Q21_01327 [Wallemia mellicola]TIB90289.1 hypothetical protein E3Q20_01314 [Wallemia mellicola]TIC06306.1 hypothetical protein E3Q16_01273 [Wallemia mellicola]